MVPRKKNYEIAFRGGNSGFLPIKYTYCVPGCGPGVKKSQRGDGARANLARARKKGCALRERAQEFLRARDGYFICARKKY